MNIYIDLLYNNYSTEFSPLGAQLKIRLLDIFAHVLHVGILFRLMRGTDVFLPAIQAFRMTDIVQYSLSTLSYSNEKEKLC